MRQRIVATLGAIVTLGLFLLTNAKRLADAISIIHLPHDVEELLTSMSQTPVLISYSALAIGLVCLTYLAISRWWPKPKPPAPDKPIGETAQEAPEKPPILPKPLKELFENDFPRLDKKMRPVPVTFENSPAIDCMMFLYQDFDSGVEFTSFYIPMCGRPVDVCDYFANNFRRDYDQLKAQIHFNIRAPGETVMDRGIDLPLSGRVYLYHEDEMDYQDYARLKGLFRLFGLIPRFRGPNYTMDEWKKLLLAEG
jgi:hypothetical protein